MRTISVDELWAWGIILTTVLVLILITGSTRRLRQEWDRQQEITSRRFKHLWNPLAGDSHWGSVRPPLALPIAFLVLAAVCFRLFFNPLWGCLFAIWGSVIALAVWLDRVNRKRAHPKNEEPPDMVTRWIRVAIVFIASLAILLFLHELMGVTMLILSAALAGLTFRDHRRLIEEEARRQQENRAVIRDAGRL